MGGSQATHIEPQNCSLCLSKYQRTRPSTTTCTHCSLLLCSDCMNDHNNELSQNVTQLFHQFHELEQLLETKQTMVATEFLQSTEEISQCVKTYNNNLVDTIQTITAGIGDAKQDAEVIGLLLKQSFHFFLFRNI
jgi:3-methyladenine DNA glycosylase AlkD